MDTETRLFFEKHNIDLKYVIDANQNPVNDSLIALMRNENKYFVYNTTFCEKGHNLRSRSKHCIVCDTFKIQIYKELYDPGFVYIAGSKRKGIIKIGSSKDNWTIIKREGYLNEKKGYAETNDWKILYSVFCDKRGFHEKEIHKLMKPFHAEGFVYQKEDLTNSTEVYYSSYKNAHKIFCEYFENKSVQNKMIEREFDQYAFRTLRRV